MILGGGGGGFVCCFVLFFCGSGGKRKNIYLPAAFIFSNTKGPCVLNV